MGRRHRRRWWRWWWWRRRLAPCACCDASAKYDRAQITHTYVYARTARYFPHPGKICKRFLGHGRFQQRQWYRLGSKLAQAALVCAIVWRGVPTLRATARPRAARARFPSFPLFSLPFPPLFPSFFLSFSFVLNTKKMPLFQGGSLSLGQAAGQSLTLFRMLLLLIWDCELHGLYAGAALLESFWNDGYPGDENWR